MTRRGENRGERKTKEEKMKYAGVKGVNGRGRTIDSEWKLSNGW